MTAQYEGSLTYFASKDSRNISATRTATPAPDPTTWEGIRNGLLY